MLLLLSIFALGSPSPDAFARHTEKVADHVWLIYRTKSSTEPPFEGNVEVFEQAKGLVIVDAGGCPTSGNNVVREIKKLSRKPVRFLIYTHFHGDHNLGAGAFRKAWPNLTIISTEATRTCMMGKPMEYIKTYANDYQGLVDFAKTQSKNAKAPETMRAGWQHIVTVGPSMVAGYRKMSAYPADMTFTNSISLPDETVPLEVRFLGRANTDGDAVVWAPKQSILATGDIVVHPVPYASACYPKDWIEVLQKVKAIPFQKLIPGHGPVLTDTTYLDKLSRTLESIRVEVGELARNGASLKEVQDKVRLTNIVMEFCGTNEWDRFAMRNFFVSAIVSNAYKEAKSEPIIQGVDGG